MSRPMTEKQLVDRAKRLCEFMEEEGWAVDDGCAVCMRVIACCLVEEAFGDTSAPKVDA